MGKIPPTKQKKSRIRDKKIEIRVNLRDDIKNYVDGSLKGLEERILTSLLEEERIYERYELSVGTEWDYGDTIAVISLTGIRTETDEEFEKRKDRAKNQRETIRKTRETIKKQKEEQERLEYERLKVKYEKDRTGT